MHIKIQHFKFYPNSYNLKKEERKLNLLLFCLHKSLFFTYMHQNVGFLHYHYGSVGTPRHLSYVSLYLHYTMQRSHGLKIHSNYLHFLVIFSMLPRKNIVYSNRRHGNNIISRCTVSTSQLYSKIFFNP